VGLPPDPLLCAYTAGFIDGEGCLAITCRRKPEGRATYYEALMVVAQSDLVPLQELQAAFGGSIHVFRSVVQQPVMAKRTVYHWHLSGKRLRVCLLAVFPYLRVKAAKAELMLEFLQVVEETKVRDCRNGIPEEAEALRRSYYERMKQMRVHIV
jgi:LAGLIDADG endonuclease